LAYAVQGVHSAPTTVRARGASLLYRFRLVLLAGAMAVSFVAVETPAVAQAHATEAQRIVRIAKTHLGAHFLMGATGPRYFDCSGFIFRVYQQAHLLPRIGGGRMSAQGYYYYFRRHGRANRHNPQVGDLVIYKHKGKIAHSAIYIGHGRIISALINPWGVKITTVRGIHVHLLAYLHVRLQR
jgi:cell wall-associated NlpC family hydrolase